MNLYMVFQARFPTDFDGELVGIFDSEKQALEVAAKYDDTYTRVTVLNEDYFEE